jgi:hypothetical protein
MRVWIRVACLVCTLSVISLAQNISSSVRTAIADGTGAAVVGAECVLTNSATANTLTVRSGADGGCVFPTVAPGTYSLSV